MSIFEMQIYKRIELKDGEFLRFERHNRQCQYHENGVGNYDTIWDTNREARNEAEALRQRLASAETRAQELQHENAELRWRLGEGSKESSHSLKVARADGEEGGQNRTAFPAEYYVATAAEMEAHGYPMPGTEGGLKLVSQPGFISTQQGGAPPNTFFIDSPFFPFIPRLENLNYVRCSFEDWIGILLIDDLMHSGSQISTWRDVAVGLITASNLSAHIWQLNAGGWGWGGTRAKWGTNMGQEWRRAIGCGLAGDEIKIMVRKRCHMAATSSVHRRMSEPEP